MKNKTVYLWFLKPLLVSPSLRERVGVRLGWGGFLLLFTITSFAQQNKNFFYTYAKGEKFVVVPELVLQIAPSLGAATSDTLAFGTPVNVLMQVPYSEVIDGYEIPWLKISYKKGAFTKVSFVLANKLSLVSVKVEDEVYVLGWGGRMNRVLNDTSKILKDNFFVVDVMQKQLQPILDFSSIENSDSISFNYRTNLGLKKTQGLFRLGFHNKIEKRNIKHYFILCGKNSFLELPFIYDDLSASLEGNEYFFPSDDKKLSKINFKNGFGHLDSKLNFSAKVYKFNNCSYTLIPPKK